MLGLGQESLVQAPHIIQLLGLDLKVNKGLPDNLGHVQPRLLTGKLVNSPGAIRIAQNGLQLGVLDPGGAIPRVELEVLLVEDAAAVELAQLDLQLDVAFVIIKVILLVNHYDENKLANYF